MIIANIATYPERKSSLEIVIKSILHQVDILNVYLNEYNEIPDFLNNAKINCVLGKDGNGNMKDNGKFYFLKETPKNSYYFTIDDDIIYPKNYVHNLVEKLHKYDNKFVVGVHGMIFPQYFADFVETRRVFNFFQKLSNDIKVSALGTGTVAFHRSVLNDFSIDFFEKTGMADLYFAAYCKKSDISMICIEHGEGWLIEIEQEKTLWNDSRDSHLNQNALINEYELWDLSLGLLEGYRAIIENELLECQKELMKIKNSKAFRIGDLFFRSVKNPHKLIFFPYNFFRILFYSDRG